MPPPFANGKVLLILSLIYHAYHANMNVALICKCIHEPIQLRIHLLYSSLFGTIEAAMTVNGVSGIEADELLDRFLVHVPDELRTRPLLKMDFGDKWGLGHGIVCRFKASLHTFTYDI